MSPPPRLLVLLRLCVVIWIGLGVGLVATPAQAEAPVWRDHDAAGEVRVHLYFYWTRSCPHCQDQRPIVERLAAQYPWLVVHSHELSADPEAARQYAEIADGLGQQARYVPAIALCETLNQGFVPEAELDAQLLACRAGSEGGPMTEPATVELPLFGDVDLQRWSLPVTTVVLASLDAFNPCAFFVLLFLLSLLVRSQTRARMLMISAIFIVISGVWYFVFMAAWLNLFLWFGELRWLTFAAGLVAIVMASLNIKDFFAPGHGPSLSIPKRAKPGLFARMRKLAKASSLPSAVAATVLLAVVANSYELLCSAGLPMIYTRVLTLAELPTGQYYLYLALYNLIYVVPLMLIVGFSIRTLGKRKLQEREGRALELMSGLMMLGLGLTLVLAPEWLARIGVAAGLVAVAGALTLLAVQIDRRRRAKQAQGSAASTV